MEKLLEKRNWFNNVLSKFFETVGSILVGLWLALSNRSSFLNMGVISAILSSLGNLPCSMLSLIQFAKLLQEFVYSLVLVY